MRKLIIFSAPSGCGKDTIVRELNKNNDYTYSVSATSRDKRPGEVEGKDYYFISADEFKEKIRNGEFAEFCEVYPNVFYGTLKSEIRRLLEGDKDVMMILDVNGALNLKYQYRDDALLIFIMPPSIEELKNRLKHRQSESDAEIESRLKRAEYEIFKGDLFDYKVVNDDLNTCINKIKRIIDGTDY